MFAGVVNDANDLMDDFLCEDEEDENFLIDYLLLLQRTCFLYYESFLKDGRISAEKELEHVIPTSWWEAIDSDIHDHSGEFRRAFRMSRTRFNILVDFVVGNWISVHGLKSFECAQAEKGGLRMQVAIALHWASLESGLRTTASLFGVCRTKVWSNVSKVMDVILAHSNKFIKLPENWKKVSEDFEKVAGIPCVAAAVDGTHILLNRPENWIGIYNRKGVPSLNMQGIVDSKAFFMSISIKHGSCNDVQVWNDSSFGRNVESIIPPKTFLLGDSIYKLRPNMMIPYENTTRDSDERRYNYKHSITRNIVERAFALLKGRWRVMKHLRVHGIEEAARIIEFCVCLHNFALQDTYEQNANDFESPDILLGSRVSLNKHTVLPQANVSSSNAGLIAGRKVRNALKDYLSQL